MPEPTTITSARSSAVSPGASSTGTRSIHTETLCSSRTFISLSFGEGMAGQVQGFRNGKGRPRGTALETSSRKGRLLGLERQPAEALVELRDAAALLDLALAAGPGRVAGRVDVEVQ